MATIFVNGAEALANGVAPTPLNSGGGGETAFSQVVPGAGGTIVADSSDHAYGANCYTFTPASGVACYVEYDVTAGNSYAIRMTFKLPSLPSAAMALMQMRNTGGTRTCTVGFNTVGKLLLQNGADATKWTAAAAISTNTWYRVEARALVGTTTSNGTLECEYYSLGSTTPIDGSGTLTGEDAGITNVNAIRYGKLTGTYAAAFKGDIISYRADGSTLIGPYSIVAPGAPTSVVATAGTLQLTGVGCTAPASNGGNAIQSYTFKASPGGNSVTQAGPTGAVITGLNGNIAYTVTATANNGFFDSVASAPSSAVTVNPGAVTPAPFNRYVAHGGVLVPVTRYRATGGSLV